MDIQELWRVIRQQWRVVVVVTPDLRVSLTVLVAGGPGIV
jgi:hypothetical protein